MHGIPASLDLSAFHGSSLTQLCIGEFQLQLHFQSSDQSPLEIAVEGQWELLSSDSQLLEAGNPMPLGEHCRLHTMLGSEVTATSVMAPRSFALTFSSGHQLHIFDSSDEYETVSIHPLGVII